MGELVSKHQALKRLRESARLVSLADSRSLTYQQTLPPETPTMTPRERVLAALDRSKRTASPSISAGIDRPASRPSPTRSSAAYLGLPERPVRVYDIVQQLAVIDEDVLDRFGVDTIEMGRGFSLCRRRLGRLGPARRHALPGARLVGAGT